MKKGKVAVVGSGPAGLSCAGELASKGYAVTVFEALHKAGGVLVYGIPEFRLPKRIVEEEVENLKRLGVEIRCNTVIGKTFTVDELLGNGFDAVFIGSGAGLPNFMNIPGEGLKGVYSANEFLTMGEPYEGISPGFSDPYYEGRQDRRGRRAATWRWTAARTALRLGAAEVNILYRRSEAELPARREEVEHAKEEGIQFRMLCAPVEILGYHNENDPRDPQNGFVQALLLR